MIGQYEQLKADIAEVIRENGRQEITGDILQQVLLGMVGELGGGATFAGIAEPQPRAEALTPDNDVFYLVFDKGTYGQFGGIEVTDIGMLGVVYIKDGEWTLTAYGERWKKVTYQELVSLSRNHKLIPGMSYRITDYETIVNPSLQDVQSASHHFDVVVTALTETVLDEDARAVHRNSEPYFKNSRVQLWRLKYALIGYDQYYDWVDNANNKGVIYFMRDEFGNECGYDFKNIQFKRWNVTDSVEGRNISGYMGVHDNLAEGLTIPDEDDWRWAYTFDNNGVDASLEVVGYSVAFDNIIGETKDWKGMRILAGNVFYGHAHNNVLGYNCSHNTFNEADENTLGNDCNANAIMTMRLNTIGNNFLGNSGELLQDNTMGNSVNLNKWKTVTETNIGNFVAYNAWESVWDSTIGNGIKSTVIESAVGYVQILDGVSGTPASPITIPFDSDAGMDVQCAGMIGGVVKVWKPAELATYGEQEVRVTYSELMTLLQSARLTSGKVYRITDYETVLTSDITTAQSAGHVFDVLVTAVAENELSEDARAIHHDGDTYFVGSQLKSWVLKYSLFNDTTRFGWADQLNSKGVIYFMRDEFGNECGYDFKNIQFKRWNVTDSVAGRNISGYMGVLNNLAEGLTIPDEDDWRWAYTFDNNGEDASLEVVRGSVALDNIIGETKNWNGKRSLAGNVFYGYARKNVLGYNCDNNTFKEANENTLGNECDLNVIMTLRTNTIGSNFLGNSGVLLQNNTMGNSVYLNKWKTVSETNIGNFVTYNAWENVQYSTIGNGIESTVIESAVGYAQILDGVSGRTESPATIPFVAGTDSQCAGMIGGAVKVWKPAERGLAVVEIEGATTYTLNAVTGKYYRFEQAEVLNLVLPVPDSTEVASVVLGVPFIGGASLTVTSEADVRYQDGFEIEEMTNYEINCLWNGLRWVVAAMKIAEA